MEGQNEKCFNCGSNDVFHINTPHYWRGVKREDVYVCEKCSYGQCRTCGREYNIDQIGVATCRCGAHDLCYACKSTSRVRSYRCGFCADLTTEVHCDDQTCQDRVRERVAKDREQCGVCGLTFACLHSILHERGYRNAWKGYHFCVVAGCRKYVCYSCATQDPVLCRDHLGDQEGMQTIANDLVIATSRRK